ncbi:hypothetical protein SAMN02745181_2088 [Rubritalea squalenifaciens DSM 18772]|uniref:Uncharacterized protein n=1 Tax=Rubritalea squalenifaciens DSM 18772 TaxID=1123071 RepID=A0A1M6JDD3_9BACT|nr:hypothetical protein [Rubritalea squalenifaciens]SHJ44721.1 hypothetical protein SAMN02745181_2088 [Rubritalea squalenifaciens DSM 18772]
MPHRHPHPDLSLQENLDASRAFLKHSSLSGARTKKYFTLGGIIAWSPLFLPLIGLSSFLPEHYYRYSTITAFVICVCAIVRHSKLPASLIHCENCNTAWQKENHEDVDYYVCHPCQTYFKGGDFS